MVIILFSKYIVKCFIINFNQFHTINKVFDIELDIIQTVLKIKIFSFSILCHTVLPKSGIGVAHEYRILFKT